VSTPITGHFSTTATFDLASVATGTCANQTVTVNGAAVGDTAIADPDNTAGGTQSLSLVWNAYVSAANTVTIRQCSAVTSDPVNQTWRVDVWRH
jgi:hypothetical protein